VTSDSGVDSTQWLRGAGLADGRVVDVCVDSRSGMISDVVDTRRETPRRGPTQDGTRTNDIDLEGFLLLPATAEPHAHLDKALTADLLPNPKGDLMGAIHAWVAHLPSLNVDEIAARAREAALELVLSGTTAIRTHVNVHPGLGTGAVEALVRVRNELADLCDIQIVALVGIPITGDGIGAEYRAVFRDALLTDPRIIAGGCPHLDTDPFGASDVSLAFAMEYGRPIDLHTDETLNPEHLELAYLAQRVRETGFDLGAVASHCVSLGVQPLDVQHKVAALVADAGVSVITLPQTNLFLQGRDNPVSTPRGLTAIRPLLDAGVVVGAGADNVRDPFNSMGRSDALETAALLVMAGHLLPSEALHAVSNAARQVMGLPQVTIATGSPAELVAVRGVSIGDAMARADQERMVWHQGRLVASTRIARTTYQR
jgi:cytosine/creatinine deaminase